MSLNEIQLQILQAIKDGHGSARKIAEQLNLDVDLVKYYMVDLQKEGYTKSCSATPAKE